VLGRNSAVLGMPGRSLDVLARSLEGRPTCQGQYKVQGPIRPARQCNWMCFAQFNPACYTRGAIISPVLLDVLCICCWKQQECTSIYISPFEYSHQRGRGIRGSPGLNRFNFRSCRVRTRFVRPFGRTCEKNCGCTSVLALALAARARFWCVLAALGTVFGAETTAFWLVLAALARSVLTSSKSNKTL